MLANEQNQDVTTGHTRTPSLLTCVVLHSVHLQGSSDDETSIKCNCISENVRVIPRTQNKHHTRHGSEKETSQADVLTAAKQADVVALFYKGNKYCVPRHFFTNEHPGGAAMLKRYPNTDITSVFHRFHRSREAEYVLEQWRDVIDWDSSDANAESIALLGDEHDQGSRSRIEAMRGRLRDRAAHAMAIISARRRRSRNRMIRLFGGVIMTCIVCYRLRRLILTP